MRLRFVTGIIAVGFLSACGGSSSGHVELSDKTPAEGSALAANAVCGRVAVCGQLEILCSGGGPAGGTVVIDCTATIRPVERAACYADAQPDIEQLLSCPGLTAAHVDMIELCVDALAKQTCYTQAQADALAAQAETNGGMLDLGLPECAFFDDPSLLPPGC